MEKLPSAKIPDFLGKKVIPQHAQISLKHNGYVHILTSKKQMKHNSTDAIVLEDTKQAYKDRCGMYAWLNTLK